MREKTKEILEKVKEVEQKIQLLRTTVEEIISFCKESNILDGIETEEEFIQVLAEVIDELIKLPAPYEWFDDKIASVVLKLIDKHLIHRIAGDDWFKKLKERVSK